MRVLRSAILNWFVTGLFAAVAVLGQALHGLPGCNHGVCDSHCDEDCGCEHSEHACAVRPGHESSPCNHAAADCSICKFFSQAKALGQFGPSADCATLVADVPSWATIFASLVPLRPFDARGPPAA
jgi:hypothetical protein